VEEVFHPEIGETSKNSPEIANKKFFEAQGNSDESRFTCLLTAGLKGMNDGESER
jgi:hypothetical protein